MYGWIEATWDGTNFEFISAAYESSPGVAIAAGAGPVTAVPEASMMSTLGIGALVLGARAVSKQRALRRTQGAAAETA